MATAKKQTQSSALSVTVYDIAGGEVKSMELPTAVFSVEVSKPLIAQALRVYMANQRSGTASAKTRSEITGSTRKIYRQKGTGRARHGDIKAPIFVGGGVVGGPKPKDYSLGMNRGMRLQALFSALSMKAEAKEIVGLSEKGLEKVEKTKTVADFLKKLGLAGKKVTFVMPKMEKTGFLRSVGNIQKITVVDAMSLNTYLILNSNKLVFFESAVDAFKNHFLKAKS